ncbi:MAG TPA: M13 family metallopeptidase [Candidatus Paceibacterota bacterium]|nr:M13 family metallopeptidase [Candidatus Paceibacterota bacterium]
MSSIEPENFDRNVRPADDFFRYVNGGWLAKNPIPPEEAQWGSFYTLRRDVELQLKEILDDLAAKRDEELPPGSDGRRVRDFYREAMDMEKRNRLGMAPLGELFAKIDAIQDGDTLAAAVGYLQRLGAGVWWMPSSEQDEKQSEVVALHLYQGGLGLPDRDYYLNDDEKSKKIRADYLAYMKEMLAHLGSDAVAAGPAADGVMEVETGLARASMTRVELRDVEKLYHKMSLGELAALTPRIAWRKYFEAAAMPVPAYFIVGQPKFFAEVDRLWETLPLDRIKTYLRWHVLNGMAGFLDEGLERQRFDFYARTFNGAKEMKPLWRRALAVTDASLDEMLGKLYVGRHFGGDAKRKINDLVDHLAAAYRARIARLEWMGAETKRKAQEKLDAVSRKLGYPDVWKDMRALEVAADSYARNVMRACAFEFDRKMREVGGPVNRNEWFMSPQTVNAYYQPPLNEIAFPAAILQPPFFDPVADDAVNFGGIGSVIGHELTHGLDDQGAKFDAKGNLSDWWTPEDKQRFDAKAAHLAEQFDKYEPLPGAHVNGKLTLGENIADLGGLLIAYDALRSKLDENPAAAAEKIDGFTPEQRFFMGCAVTERSHSREELLRLRLQTDPHSPSEFRVNGPVSNMEEFYEAFGVKEGDRLWRAPEDRVKIW